MPLRLSGTGSPGSSGMPALVYGTRIGVRQRRRRPAGPGPAAETAGRLRL